MKNKKRLEDEMQVEMEEKNAGGEKKFLEKNKLLILLVILLIVILCGGIYLCYDNFLSKQHNETKEDEKLTDEEDEKLTDEDDENYSEKYIIYDGNQNKVYEAIVDDFLTDGKKEEIISDIYKDVGVSFYKNQVFYLNNNFELSVYNIKTKETTTYKIDGKGINSNSIIMPGEDYTIIGDINNFIRLDMKSKKINNFNIVTNNTTMLYDDLDKTLYYINESGIESYNVVSGVITKGIGSGRPIYIDDEYVYIDRDYAGDKEDEFYLDLYNKKTKQTVSLERDGYGISVFVSNNNDNRYFVVDGSIVKIDKYNKATKIHSYQFLNAETTSRSLFIMEYEIVNDYDIGTISGDIKTIYEYDYENGTKKIIDNKYVSYLDECNVYYVEK